MDESQELLEETFRGRCSAAQKKLWEQAARIEKRNLSDWIRIVLDDAAEKVVSKTQKKSK